MNKKFGLALVCAATLLNSACSAQEPAPETTTVESVEAAPTVETTFQAPDDAWRDVDPENTLYIDVDYGQIIVELYPEIAPLHVEQIKKLTRINFYDHVKFHRVLKGFMNQTGDPSGNGTGDSELPDIEPEFTFRRPMSMPVTLIGQRPLGDPSVSTKTIDVGFYKGLQVATQPSAQSMLTKDGMVGAFGLHCKGVTSMARTEIPNSANSQFFLMRGTAAHLDAQYSIWGSTVYGRENLTKIKLGTVGEDAGFVPDEMNKVRIGADLPEAERVNVQVLKTDSPAFQKYLSTQKKADGTYPDICDIAVPTRAKPN